jgi:hypothetical protein
VLIWHIKEYIYHNVYIRGSHERVAPFLFESIQKYIDEINKIMSFDSENELLYRDVLDRIVVYSGNVIVVYLNCVPFGVKLHHNSFGRMEKYSVVIDGIEIVNE